MSKSSEISRSAAQELRTIFSRASSWEELRGVKAGAQTAELVVKFKIGSSEHRLALETTSLGQPRQIREAMARLSEIRRALPDVYPLAVSQYIGPQSAALLKRNGFGYLDLSGNCYLSFENVLIEREGKRNAQPSTRPLKSLFA